MSLKKLLHIILIITVALGAKLTHKQDFPPSTTVKQSNHFYSQELTSTTYDINNVNTDLPLVLILRPREQTFQSNPIHITLISGSNKVPCNFTSYDSVCVMQKIPDSKMQMQIKCDKTPCSVMWTIYQTELNNLLPIQNLDQLYRIKESAKHTIVIVSCNNPEFKDLQTGITMYSDNTFTRAFVNNVVYYLFSNQNNGYMYFKATPQAKVCAQLSIYNISGKLGSKDFIKDFILKSQKSVFEIIDTPKSAFRLDCSMHNLLKKNPIASNLEIQVTGEQNSQRKTIIKSVIVSSGKKETFDFSYTVKQLDPKWKNIRLEFQSTDQIIMLNADYIEDSTITQVERGEVTYLGLKKGDKMLYQLIKEEKAPSNSTTYFLCSNNSRIKATPISCKSSQGCNFTVEALEDFNSEFIYVNTEFKSEFSQKIVVYDIQQSVTKKIKQNDFLYFSKKILSKKSVQVVINSPNVMIYASKKEKCPQPNESCYQKIGNNHHAFIYEAQVDTDLIIAVLGLDNGIFTLSVISEDDEFIKLQDGVAFSYEMDDQEDQIVFKFQIKQKVGVSFNLISPLHSLSMQVSNSKKKPKEDDEDLKSIDGYAYFTKSDIDSLFFTILISKTHALKKKTVHFSIIASTTGTNMILETGVTHYETLAKNQKRQFVFQFQKQQDYIINFYTHNAVGQIISIQLEVANKDDSWTDKSVQSFEINTAADNLNLKDISKKLCAEQKQLSCEIFLRITNKMDREIDLTITLLVNDAIIELKDGLWQSFITNSVSTTSHFFFFPRHQNKSVTILFKTTFSDLRIGYSLWRAEDKTINPIDWPFPVSEVNFEKQKQQFSYSPVKHVSIGKQALKSCWPSCVVLISLIHNSSPEGATYLSQIYSHLGDSFTLLVSNNILEIPQKTKIDVILTKKEQKFFLIDLKSISDKKKAMTIFTSTTMGSVDLYATVYTENNPRCASEQDSDFSFGRLETQIHASTIQKKLEENKMLEDNNVYLCIMATSQIDTKFYIQWTSDEQMIKVLEIDSYQTIQVDKDSQRIFQITPRLQEYQLKFTRNRGLPFIQLITCDGSKKDYDQCLQKVSDADTPKTQMLTKTELYSEQPCQNCIVFVKISADQPAQLDIHVQSKYSQVEVKQNTIMSDFTEKGEANRYRMVYLPNKQTVISVHVIDGDLEVSLTDLNDIHIVKKKSKDSDLIHITIPPAIKEKTKKKEQKAKDNDALAALSSILGVTMYSSYGLMSEIKYLHMTIKSTSDKTATSYTINYSSGDQQVYLQDGLLLDYKLEQKKQVTFYYQNILQKTNALMSITMKDSAALQKLSLSMFYFTDPEDEDTKVQFTPEKPPLRKKTPYPTIVYSLPSNHKLFSFVLNYDGQATDVSISINHLEVILLPYDTDFPFMLSGNETLNLLVDVINPGFLQVNVRKCDDSNPQFAYTFDEPSFQKGQYTFTTTLADDPSFQQIIKANEVGTLYMMIKAEEPTTLSIRVSYSDVKMKGSKIKPGNKGILEYQLLSSEEAEISFSGGVCPSGKCPDIKYYTICGVQMQSLYSQTVCPSSFFATSLITSSKPLPLVQITSKADSNNKITFKYKLLDHISYLSVKGIYSNGEEIYYRPIEIVTLWGQLSRTSGSHKFFVAFLVLSALCALLICVRRSARKGYKPLDEERD